MARAMDLDLTKHEYQFTRNWFRSRNLPTFREFVYPRWGGGKPNLKYLEIGVFEGMSMVWMCEHILNGPGSYAVGVDPWQMTTKLSAEDMEGVYKRALLNTSYYNRTLIRGSSAEAVRRMAGRRGYEGISKQSVDICQIDGNHFDYAVLDDARIVLPLMKRGGTIIFDDYENDIPKENHVKHGVELWLKELPARTVTQIWKHRYCVAFEVL